MYNIVMFDPPYIQSGSVHKMLLLQTDWSVKGS